MHTTSVTVCNFPRISKTLIIGIVAPVRSIRVSLGATLCYSSRVAIQKFFGSSLRETLQNFLARAMPLRTRFNFNYVPGRTLRVCICVRIAVITSAIVPPLIALLSRDTYRSLTTSALLRGMTANIHTCLVSLRDADVDVEAQPRHTRQPRRCCRFIARYPLTSRQRKDFSRALREHGERIIVKITGRK